MEAVSLISSLFFGLPIILILVMVVAVVLQWSYQLICRRHLRYTKACKLILVLFLINVALSFLVGSITVSMSAAVQANVDLIKFPVMFLIGDPASKLSWPCGACAPGLPHVQQSNSERACKFYFPRSDASPWVTPQAETVALPVLRRQRSAA